MNQSFHNQSVPFNPPPPSQPRPLPVLEKAKSLYKNWMEIHRNIERTVRFGLGAKIDSLLLNLLETLRKAAYSPVDKKLLILNEASDKIDSIRFFVQILWEMKFIPNNKYIELETDMQNIGRIVGGWKKGLQSKTPPAGGERRQ